MPTITGSIWAQNVGYRTVSNYQSEFSDSVTLSFSSQGRDISADAAIALMWADGDWVDEAGVFTGVAFSSQYHAYYCGFTSMVRNGQFEDFGTYVPRLVATGVTQLTFTTRVVNCWVRSRWVINFWE